MNNIYLVTRRGLVYEGDSYVLRAIHPIPVITTAQCEFIEEVPGKPKGIVFREDIFDPVTRIRRGRFYRSGDDVRGWRAEQVHNYPFGPHVGVGGGVWDADARYNVVEHLSTGARIESSLVFLGETNYETQWRVVAAEKISTGHLLFTLRAMSSLGALPELAAQLKNNDGDSVTISPIQSALDKIVNAFHIQQAIPIVDVCRESARVILAAWVGESAETNDLSNVIKKIPGDQLLIDRAASIINRLHPRGKSSEQENQAKSGKNLRMIADEDAEASVHLIGLILREIGWAAP